MFQYATGKALSLKHKVQLKLDVEDFKESSIHQGFELNAVFTSEVELASELDIHGILGWQKKKFLRKILRKEALSFIRKESYVVEPGFSYWDGFSGLDGNTYLDGYWQSEKYFKNIDANIRSDFTFKKPFSKSNLKVASYISNSNAISLHVRRGDYVSNMKTNSVHGVCSINYYRDAIKYISSHVNKPVFFIFSDDITWVKNNLVIGAECVYVDHNSGADSYNDMRLMSLCKHHIIANSSFSWWGAWLGQNINKIVVAPKKWFAKNKSTGDLLPTDWLKL